MEAAEMHIRKALECLDEEGLATIEEMQETGMVDEFVNHLDLKRGQQKLLRKGLLRD